MSGFEKHIRSYFSERLGVQFHCTEFGFIGWSIDTSSGGRHLRINEFYVEPGTSFLKTYRMVKDVIKLGKELGCTHLLGENDRSLPSYEDIMKMHKWFGMEIIAWDGYKVELWAREI